MEVFLLPWDANKRTSVPHWGKNPTLIRPSELGPAVLVRSILSHPKNLLEETNDIIVGMKLQLPEKSPSFLFSTCSVG